MNLLPVNCLRDTYLAVQLGDYLIGPGKHQVADRGGVAYDGHWAKMPWGSTGARLPVSDRLPIRGLKGGLQILF